MKKTQLTKTLSIILTAIVVSVTSLTSVSAQTNQWAVKMFSELGTERLHNFGSVALHANVEKRFQFKNIYKEDVVITSVSSNCGCTKATVSKQVIRPNEIGEVIAKVDTTGREHTKQRKATIRVVFSKPTTAEVQLQVKTYIRPDVGFDPGVIEFGTVPHGSKVVKKAYLQYEGRSDWALVGIQKNSSGIRAEAREVKRQGGSVVYEILVELKPDAHSGYLQDLLKFQTNEQDPATSSVFLPIQGLIVEPLCAKPSFLQFGVVKLGETITRNLVVRGSEPFKIVDIQSNDRRISSAKTNLERTVHVLPITFSADEKAGKIDSMITITVGQGKDKEKRQEIIVSTTGFIKEETDSFIDQIGESVPQESNIVAIPDEDNRRTVNLNVHRENREIPQAKEGLKPIPLNTKQNMRDMTAPIQKKPATDVEIQELLSDEELLVVTEQDTQADEEKALESGWTPVKSSSQNYVQTKINKPQESGWSSNWKRVKNANSDELKTEYFSQNPNITNIH